MRLTPRLPVFVVKLKAENTLDGNEEVGIIDDYRSVSLTGHDGLCGEVPRLTVISAKCAMLIVTKQRKQLLIVREEVRDKVCSTLFNRVCESPPKARPSLAQPIPAIDRFSGQWIDGGVLLVKVVFSRSCLAQQLSRSMAEELVDGVHDEADEAKGIAEPFPFGGIQEWAGMRRVTVGGHAVCEHQVFATQGLPDVEILQVSCQKRHNLT